MSTLPASPTPVTPSGYGYRPIRTLSGRSRCTACGECIRQLDPCYMHSPSETLHCAECVESSRQQEGGGR